MVILCGPLSLITAIAPPPEVAGAQIVSSVLIISNSEYAANLENLSELLKLYVNHANGHNFFSTAVCEAGFLERWFFQAFYSGII